MRLTRRLVIIGEPVARPRGRADDSRPKWDIPVNETSYAEHQPAQKSLDQDNLWHALLWQSFTVQNDELFVRQLLRLTIIWRAFQAEPEVHLGPGRMLDVGERIAGNDMVPHFG